VYFGSSEGWILNHSPLPARHEFRAEDAHVARQRDVFRARAEHFGLHRGIVLGARHALVRQGECRHTLYPGEDETACIRGIGEYQHDLERAVGQAAGIEQRGHVGAAARNEHGDPGAISHPDAP